MSFLDISITWLSKALLIVAERDRPLFHPVSFEWREKSLISGHRKSEGKQASYLHFRGFHSRSAVLLSHRREVELQDGTSAAVSVRN